MRPGQSMDYEQAGPYANGGASSSSVGGASSSSHRPFMDGPGDEQPPSALRDPYFDIIDWHPAYQSCQRYFLDHAQHEPGTQALCSLINIRLPFQWLNCPIVSSTPQTATPGAGQSPSYNFNAYSRPANNIGSPNRSRTSNHTSPPTFVSLIPYLRRLIVTGFDKIPVLHGFFGDDYVRGVMPHLECERRNYLFAAKHGGWRSCKKQYDVGSGGGGDESVPFMKPLEEAKMEELTAAEKAWSNWLAMEDWMVGPRAPEEASGGSGHAGRRDDDPNSTGSTGDSHYRR